MSISRVVTNIQNCTKQRVRCRAVLFEVATITMQLLKIKKPVEISVVFVGEQKMRTLNRKWRGVDSVTDVLSFGFLEKTEKYLFPAQKKDRIYMGEIFICFLYAKRQAKQQNISLKENLSILLVHGIIHLYGIDHERSDKEYIKTITIQKEVVRQVI